MALANDLTGEQVFQLAIEKMRRECMENKERLLQELIKEETGASIIDPEVVRTRAMIKIFPDGVEEIYWDGEVRLRIHPPSINKKGQMQQEFERIPKAITH